MEQNISSNETINEDWRTLLGISEENELRAIWNARKHVHIYKEAMKNNDYLKYVNKDSEEQSELFVRRFDNFTLLTLESELELLNGNIFVCGTFKGSFPKFILKYKN